MTTSSLGATSVGGVGGVGGRRAAEAADVAWQVAARVCDPEVVRLSVARAHEQTTYPELARWSPASTASGDAGLALVCGHLDAVQPDGGWDVEGHRLLRSAVDEAQGLSHGLYSGLSGIGLAAGALSRGGTRYARLLDALDATVAAQARAAADGLAAQGPGVPVWTFDVISGLSGTGAYLLTRVDHDPRARAALEAVLTSLVALGGSTQQPPAWHTPVWAMEQSMARQHPHGNLNCGLAHGVPGILALLSLCWTHGVRVPGADDVIRRIARWLAAHRVDDEWGPNWATAVALAPDGSELTHRREPTRSAWCYGSPGVARALWLAGTALDDAATQDLAVEAMAGVYRRPVPERAIDSPTFCHGVAGLLQITLRFAADTGRPLFTAAAEELTDQLLAAFDPRRPVGFCSVEPGGIQVDQPGLLDGAAGVALSLLAAAGGPDPAWDRLFLLS
jgi:hypothetical protein